MSEAESSDDDYDQRQYCSKNKSCPSNYVCESGICTLKVRGPPWTVTTASKLLGIDKNANNNDIKKKKKNLSLIYHPDRCPERSKDKFLEEIGSPKNKTECTEITKEINSAYDYLLSKERPMEREPQQERQRKPQQENYNTSSDYINSVKQREIEQGIEQGIEQDNKRDNEQRNYLSISEKRTEKAPTYKKQKSLESKNIVETAVTSIQKSIQSLQRKKTKPIFIEQQEEKSLLQDRKDAIKESQKHIKQEVLKIQDLQIREKIDNILNSENGDTDNLKLINKIAVDVTDVETVKVLDQITNDLNTIEVISSLNKYQTFELRRKKILQILDTYESNITKFEIDFKNSFEKINWPIITPLNDTDKIKFEELKMLEGKLQEIEEMLGSLELTKNDISIQLDKEKQENEENNI